MNRRSFIAALPLLTLAPSLAAAHQTRARGEVTVMGLSPTQIESILSRDGEPVRVVRVEPAGEWTVMHFTCAPSGPIRIDAELGHCGAIALFTVYGA